MKCYVIASTKTWNIDAFLARRARLPGRWLIVSDPRDLTVDFVTANKPRYIFFVHWSSIVPAAILNAVECVCFHMTDVPYGRGGSPLQNLILRGHPDTKLTALRMTEEIDAGPVYGKVAMNLNGAAREIFWRSAELSLDLINEIVREEPTPRAQEGKVVTFRRRKPGQSALPTAGDLHDIYDHIRMLDADTYPRAFIDHGKFRLTFREARIDFDGNSIESRVSISLQPTTKTDA